MLTALQHALHQRQRHAATAAESVDQTVRDLFVELHGILAKADATGSTPPPRADELLGQLDELGYGADSCVDSNLTRLANRHRWVALYRDREKLAKAAKTADESYVVAQAEEAEARQAARRRLRDLELHAQEAIAAAGAASAVEGDLASTTAASAKTRALQQQIANLAEQIRDLERRADPQGPRRDGAVIPGPVVGTAEYPHHWVERVRAKLGDAYDRAEPADALERQLGAAIDAANTLDAELQKLRRKEEKLREQSQKLERQGRLDPALFVLVRPNSDNEAPPSTGQSVH